MTQEPKGGRGCPPAHRRFGRGQKRAAGRPKGAVGEKAIVQKIAGELHKVQQNGQAIEVNTVELLLMSIRNLAMKAELRPAKWLTDHRTRIAPDPGEGGGYLVVPENMPTEQFIEQEMFLNKFRTDPELRKEAALRDPNARYNRDS